MQLSVIIPVRNGEACLGDLLASLAGPVRERPGEIEVIVVDDASSDGTAAVLAAYPWATTHRQARNRGVGAARNSGARIARGALLLFLDADTVATPGLLDRVPAFFAAHPEIDAASGVYLDRNPRRHAFARYLDVCETAMRAGALDRPAPGSLSGSLCALRRRVFVALGGFAEERRAALEDVELGLRLARAGYTHWLVGDWRVAHRQPRLGHYLRELLPRTRHYLRLMRHFSACNEVMGGAGEGAARLAFAAALLGVLAAILAPGPLSGLAAATLTAAALWINRDWLRGVRRAEGAGFLPQALFFHAATTAAICAGGVLGVADALAFSWRRRVVDLAVVFAYLRSLLTPGAGGYLIQFLTHRCNAHCAHCFDHPQRAAIGKAAELDIARIRKLAASAGPLGHLSLTGGEPLLRDDLREIFAAWYAAGVRSFSLSTNGAYPEKLAELLPDILAQAPRARLIVTLSVDALGTRHDVLRGLPGLFAKVETSLARLQSLRQWWPQMRVHACLTLSAANAGQAQEAIAWLARWRLDQIELNSLRGLPADAALPAADTAAYDQVRAQVMQANGHATGLARLFAGLDGAMFDIVRNWREPWSCGSCLAGRKLAVIQADGTVLPCEMLRSTRSNDAARFDGFALGRLHEHDDNLRQLLNSAPTRRLTDYIVDSECRCSFECAIFATMAYRPWRVVSLGRKASQSSSVARLAARK
jgi:MoaA/NifB/PqqE/SkfB family radical SAM enzyme/glycosyltransferase involved in cell wall biosynthesis